MARIHFECPHCHKRTGTRNELKLKGMIVHTLECGHTYIEKLVAVQVPAGFKVLCLDCRVLLGSESLKNGEHRNHTTVTVPNKRDHLWHTKDGYQHFFNYQMEGIEFLEAANFRALDGDEMGLGKTCTIIGALRYNYEVLKPALVICPAGQIYNWQKEFKLWFNDKYTELADAPLVHTNTSGNLLEGQNIHIMSSHIISRKGLLEEIANYGFKTIVLDESHQFKNDSSNRTEALMKFAETIPYRMCASGTSIVNRTSEYFNTLHLIRPEHWPHKGYLDRYLNYVTTYNSLGKKQTIEAGLLPYRKEQFFELTRPYIIRRKKSEVYKDLPELMTPKQFINVSTEEKFVDMYNEQLDEMDRLIQKSQSNFARQANFMELLALIQMLRQTTGLMKVKPIIARVKEFMENTDETDKLTVGCHHILVRELLEKGLAEFDPISISDEPAAIKDRKQEEFKAANRRLLLASIIGAGTGRNLQFCHNAIIAEREWNPALERQFEGRFQRPIKCLVCDVLTVRENGNHYKCPKCGRVEEIDHVIIDYLNAKGTIDEFFDDMVELKKSVVDGTLDKDVSTNQEFIYELAEKCVRSRLKFVR